MIPFFRKIRKKMADDNKPIKYMRYAVGEILLVVIEKEYEKLNIPHYLRT